MIKKIVSEILYSLLAVGILGGAMCLCCLLLYAIEMLIGSSVLAYFTYGVILIVIVGTISGIIEYKEESEEK